MDDNCGCSSLNTPVKKYLKFSNTSVDVVKGAISLAGLDLSKFIEEVSDYAVIDTDILAGATYNTPTPFGSEYTALIFLVEYPTKDTDGIALVNNDKYIQFQYPEGVNTYPIGKIMILSGKEDNTWLAGSTEMKLINPHTNFDVNVKILMIK